MSKIDLNALAAEAPEGFSVKSHIKKPGPTFEFRESEWAKLAFTECSCELSEKTGAPQAVLSTEVLLADGGTAQGKRFWYDLPIPNSNLSHHENQAYIQKSGDNWLKFLRAVLPNDFKAYAKADFSDKANPKYYAADGSEMSYEDVYKRNELVSNAALALAQQTWDGKWSPVGLRCSVFPNVSAQGRMFLNLYSLDAAEDDEVAF